MTGFNALGSGPFSNGKTNVDKQRQKHEASGNGGRSGLAETSGGGSEGQGGAVREGEAASKTSEAELSVGGMRAGNGSFPIQQFSQEQQSGFGNIGGSMDMGNVGGMFPGNNGQTPQQQQQQVLGVMFGDSNNNGVNGMMSGGPAGFGSFVGGPGFGGAGYGFAGDISGGMGIQGAGARGFHHAGFSGQGQGWMGGSGDYRGGSSQRGAYGSRGRGGGRGRYKGRGGMGKIQVYVCLLNCR